MLKMRKSLGLLLVLAFMAAIMAGCAGTPSTTTPASGPVEADANAADEGYIEFKIAFCTWAGYAPLYIAQEKGFFEDLGIKPELIIMEDESQYAAALVSGSIHALGNVLDRDIIHYAVGAPEQYLCTMDASTGGDGIIATADIKTMDDLKGKTVAMDKSATSYFFFLVALEDANITENDINIVEMGSSEAGEAFMAGHVDAAVTWEPWLSTASEREGGHILVSSADYPHTIIDILTVNSHFVAEFPTAVTALEQAWYQAVDYYNANPEESYAIMAEGLGLTAEEVKDECAGITFMGEAENQKFNDPATENNIYDVAALAASYWAERGLIDNAELQGFFGK